MALMQTLKATALILLIAALLFVVIILGEFAIVYLLDQIEDRKARRKGRRRGVDKSPKKM